jgi:fructoselysine-6-P-deglycase FrlB-like protein
VVAVTNVEASPLAAIADIVIPLHAGEEASGIACRTFRATVAALAMLSGMTEPDGLRPAVAALRSRIDATATWLPPMADALDGAPSIDVLADGSLLGLAEQAALMLREAPRLPAHAAETGDWLHTGVYLALPGHRALLFPGSTADDEVVATIRRRGGEVVLIPAASDGMRDAITRALGDSVVAELLACELWRRASADDKAT